MTWFPMRFRSYGAGSGFCVSGYKDMTPTELFFDGLSGSTRRSAPYFA